MEKYKIGQEIIIDKDKKIESVLGNTVIDVKKGDKALITRNSIKFLTGEARGKIMLLEKEKIEGFDMDNIIKRIAKNVYYELGQYVFDEFLEEMDLSLKDVEDSIYEELSQFI